MNNKLKNRIEELEQKHRFISDNLLDAIWVIDAKTLKYEYITPSIKKISGYTVEDYMDMTINETLAPESLETVVKLLAEERKRFDQGTKVIRTLELELLRKDGSPYWNEVKAKFYKEKNKPLKIIGVSRDITERKEAEKKQNELIEKLGKALAEKEKLLKENKVLTGLLPICSGCKRIRDEYDKWWPLEAYVKEHTEADLTHTICHDCKDIYYGDL